MKKITPDNDETRLRELIRDFCIQLEIPCFGIANAERWDTPLFEPWIPEPFRPWSIYPETRSVIVIGLPIHLPVLESAPSIWYHEEYKTVNSLLDQYTWRIASLLNSCGFPSVSIPRDGYGSINVLLKNPVAFFSHRHAAFLAGLGTFGRNNMILTREWGPRVRFGTVLTSAAITADQMIHENLCTCCNACVRACPVHALDEEDYPDALTDKTACANRSASLNKQHISPCGICIKVCPIGEDRIFYRRADIRMYEDRERWPSYTQAWEHVQKYGGEMNMEDDNKHTS